MHDVTTKLIAVLPEVFVLVMACATLLLGVFFERVRNLPFYLVQLTLVVTLLLLWNSYSHLGFNSTTILFDGMFELDRLAFVLKLFILIAVFFTFMYSRFYNDERLIPNTEFYVLGLLSTLGMMVLVSSHNLLTLFLGMELMALPIYAMVALQRGKERCVEAAIKYFIIGALATGMMLYGMSLLFGVTQSLDIATIAKTLTNISLQHNLVLLFGLVFILTGIAFKLGAAPFHMWVPDVYDGSPSSVTIFLSAAPKLAAFGLAVRLLVDGMPSLALEWSHMLIVLAICSIAIGNLAAIVQTNIKRMLAYSSIAHMGYMILGLVCANQRGYSAALFYIISYTIMTLGAFGMITLMARAGFEANLVEDFAGLNDRNPWLAFIMLVIMFSMAGVPPLVGFIAKVSVIEALIQAHLVWLSVFAILFAIIGAYYYIRVVRVMYFGDTEGDTVVVRYGTSLKVAISLNGLMVLVLGIFPGTLFALCHLTF